jgi:hypothetical protein
MPRKQSAIYDQCQPAELALEWVLPHPITLDEHERLSLGDAERKAISEVLCLTMEVRHG